MADGIADEGHFSENHVVTYEAAGCGDQKAHEENGPSILPLFGPWFYEDMVSVEWRDDGHGKVF